MKFVDSGIFIGAFNPRDTEHKKSAQIIECVDKKTFRAVITDYILDEILTFVRRKAGYEKSVSVSNYLTFHGNIEILRIDEECYLAAFYIFQKYPTLSFTDSTTVAVILNHGIKYIYSFDKGFDSVKEIKRLGSI